MKKGLTYSKITEYLDEKNLDSIDDIMNNINNIYTHIMTLHTELGLTGLTGNEFEQWVKQGFQNALFQHEMNKHFKGVFNGNN